MPLVSVVVPAYNAARFVAEAIESVLAQTYGERELIVVDDGSADETSTVVRRYGSTVRYLDQANAGVAAARNRGIEAASGEYVAFLDADDVWLPSKLERQMRALHEQPTCRACYTAVLDCDVRLTMASVHLGRRRRTSLEDLLLIGNVVGTPSTVVCERGLFSAAGGFDPTLSLCADWDLWIRLAKLTEFACVAEPLVRYRRHSGNMSRDVPLLERDSLHVFEKAFAATDLPHRLSALRRPALAHQAMVLAGSYFGVGRRRDALRWARRAMALDVGQISYLLAYPLRSVRRWFAAGSRSFRETR